MGWSPLPTNASPLRTLALVAGLAALMVGSGFGASNLGGRHSGLSVAPWTGPTDSGALQFRAASASLLRGEGPASVPASTLPTSPGSYSWTNLTPILSGPPSGRVTSMAWDASDGYVLLWGGQSTSGGLLRDTWTYANGTWTNLTTIVGASPPAAPFQVVAYDPSSQKIVMFSGQNNTTWTYHNQVWANVTGSAGAHPPAVIGESFVTDTTDNEAVFFGGQYIYLNGPIPHATWVFKNGGWSNISSTAPFQFGRVVLPFGADDPPDHGVLAVGLAEWSNITPFLYHMSTYLFSGGSWTNLTLTLPQEPPIAELPGFGYLPSITADVLVVPIVVNSTGQVGSTEGVTWEFRHSIWTNVTDVTGAQPNVGLITGSAVDPVDGTMLVFGGQQTHLFTPYFYPATWLMSAPPTVTASLSRASVDAGQPVTFTATASGGASPVTVRWNLGDGTNSTSLSGSHTYGAAAVITASVTGTDLVGHTATATVSVVVNPALTVTADATPTSPVNGTWVALASHVSGGTPPFTYNWVLGDASTSTVSSFGHDYAKKGTYSVNLTVTDASGANASAGMTLVVQPAVTPPPASTGTGGSSVSLTSGVGLGLVIGIVLLFVLVVILAAMLAMRPRSPPPGPITTYSGVPPTQPPSGSTPPYGGSAPPPP